MASEVALDSNHDLGNEPSPYSPGEPGDLGYQSSSALSGILVVCIQAMKKRACSF